MIPPKHNFFYKIWCESINNITTFFQYSSNSAGSSVRELSSVLQTLESGESNKRKAKYLFEKVTYPSHCRVGGEIKTDKMPYNGIEIPNKSQTVVFLFYWDKISLDRIVKPIDNNEIVRRKNLISLAIYITPPPSNKEDWTDLIVIIFFKAKGCHQFTKHLLFQNILIR